MQEGDIRIEGLGKFQAFKSQAEYFKQVIKNQYDLLMEQKALDHQNQVFNLQMDKLSLHNDLNLAKKQIDNYRNIVKLMTLQRDKLQLDNNFKDAEIISLNDWIKQLQGQKERITESYTKDINELNQRIEGLESELKKQASAHSEKQKQFVKQKQKLAYSLVTLQKKSEDTERQLKEELENIQGTLIGFKQTIVQKLTRFKSEEKQFWSQEELIETTVEQLLRLRQQQASIQAILKKKEHKKNAYASMQSRVQALFEAYEKKIGQFQSILNDLELFLNSQLKKYVRKYQNCHGSQLREVISQTFIDLTCQIEGLNIKLQEEQKKDCKQCDRKENQIKNVKAQLSKQKQQKTELENSYISTLQLCEKQNKQAIEDLQRQKKKLENEVKLSRQNFNREKDELDRLLADERRKVQLATQEKQSLSIDNKNLSKELNNLTISNQQLTTQIQKKKRQLQEKQKQIKQAKGLSQNTIQNYSQKIKQVEQQLAQTIQQVQDLQGKLNQKRNKQITLQNKYEEKLDIIDDIDNRLCKLANSRCLKKQEAQARSYKEAFKILQKYLDNPPAEGPIPLFKIPSLSSKFEQSIDWIAEVIAQNTDRGKNFNSLFLGKVSQSGADFNKYFENPNILLICQNSKKAIFQIFVTKLSKGINDRFKVVLFSAEKRLKYPKNSEEIKGSIRPATLNTLGQIVFGRQELTLNRNLEMIATPNTTGYFAGLDIKEMFGIDSPTEKPLIETVQFYQIVYP